MKKEVVLGEVECAIEEKWVREVCLGLMDISVRTAKMAVSCDMFGDGKSRDWNTVVEELATDAYGCMKAFERVCKAIGVEVEETGDRRVKDGNEELYMSVQDSVSKIFGEINVRQYMKVYRMPSEVFCKHLGGYLENLIVYLTCYIIRVGDCVGERIKEEIIDNLERG